MRHYYSVYIPKCYFPSGTQDTKYLHTEIWEHIRVAAISRSDAATKAWDRRGAYWLQKMSTKETSVFHISLFVSDPESKTLASRLPPIRVFTGGPGITS